MKRITFGFLCMVFLSGCGDSSAPPEIVFSKPQKVTILGYSGNSMEPFISRNTGTLFFNNLNSAPENTNLHWALRINDSTFQYKGEIAGINSLAMEAVASVDVAGTFYFFSDRSYTNSLSSIFTSGYANGTVTSIVSVSGLSKNIAGWVNFDVEINATGTKMYFVDGRYDGVGGPYEADIVMATKTGNGFNRNDPKNDLLKNINTIDLEYAAGISYNELELYFTRVKAPLTSNSQPEIFRAGRSSTFDAFGVPSKIETITGFSEAPTISQDGKIIYYHKRESGKFVLYYVRKM